MLYDDIKEHQGSGVEYQVGAAEFDDNRSAAG